MRLIAPTLDIDEAATEDALRRCIANLPGKENPYMILEREELCYMQALWVGNGYDLEYQDGSIDEHYLTKVPVSAEQAGDAFIGYMSQLDVWKHQYEFEKKDIRGFLGRLGYSIGKFIGAICALAKRT
jgi:hypothetical protein